MQAGATQTRFTAVEIAVNGCVISTSGVLSNEGTVWARALNLNAVAGFTDRAGVHSSEDIRDKSSHVCVVVEEVVVVPGRIYCTAANRSNGWIIDIFGVVHCSDCV